MNRSICLTMCFIFIYSSIAAALQESTLSGLGANKLVTARLIMPDGKGPFPAVLVLHTSGGIKKYDIAYAQKLAQQGYACLVPFYFDAYHLTNDTRAWATTVYATRILDDFSSEIKYLQNLPAIKKDKIGAVGFSMGGYWALILAGMNKVHAGVSYYGALTGGGANDAMQYQFEENFHQNSAPVLILHGVDDMTVDVSHAKGLADLLKAKACVYEIHLYPGAGHRFDRGASLNKSAADDSWQRTLVFLKKYLN